MHNWEIENQLIERLSSHHLSLSKVELRLDRIFKLLEALGNPEQSFKSIHIVGTSGKGSTASFLSSILSHAGYRVGMHLSPHVVSIGERSQINGVPATVQELYEIFLVIEKKLQDYQTSFFENSLALALCYFRDKQCDWAILEAGVGGRFDATTAIDSEALVLTTVGLDHTELLGETLQEIADDKSDAIKSGQKVISGWCQEEMQEMVNAKCQKLASEVYHLGKQVQYQIAEDKSFRVQTPLNQYEDLKTSMSGDFQIRNAVCAISVAEQLGIVPKPELLKKSLINVTLPARMECLLRKPIVILDGSHNPDKIKASFQALQTHSYQRLIVVMALKVGKNTDAILQEALHNADVAIFTEFCTKGQWQAQSASTLQSLAKDAFPKLKTYEEPEVQNAINLAFKQVEDSDLILFCGSMYFASDIKSLWKKQHLV